MAKHSVTEYLNAFVNNAQKFYDLEPDIFITLDRQGCIERVNPAFTKETGYSESDVLRMPIGRLVLMDDWAIFFRSFTNINQPPFRLLHRYGGYVRVCFARLPFFESVYTGETNKENSSRCLLIMRRL